MKGELEERRVQAITERKYDIGWQVFRDGLLALHENQATLDEAGKEARREQAKKDYEFFIQTYFPHYLTLPGRSKLQEYLAKDIFVPIVQEKQGAKYALAAPRGFAKSTHCAKLFPLWCLVKEAKRFVVLISDALELAELHLEAIKVELEANANLRLDFPQICGIGSPWRIGEFKANNGCYFKAFGAGKRLRGMSFGTERPDLVILDDLENNTNVRSRPQRDRLEQWLDTAVLNLGSVEGDLDVLFIGSILHRDSVLARKLKLKFWNPNVFRALESMPTRMDLWEKYSQIYRTGGLAKAETFFRKHRKPLEKGAKLLWPAMDLQFLMQKRAENPKAFAQEMQNNPLLEAQTFSEERMHFYNPNLLPTGLKTFIHCDPAGDGHASHSLTSFTVLGMDEKERKGYVLESLNQKMGSKKIVKTLIDLAKQYRPKQITFETNGGAISSQKLDHGSCF